MKWVKTSAKRLSLFIILISLPDLKRLNMARCGKYKWMKAMWPIAIVAFLLYLSACKKEHEGIYTIDIFNGCLYPQAVPLSHITDSVEIIRFPVTFNRDRILMFDSAFVIASTDACLLFDRKGRYIREIARQGEAPDEYQNCQMMNQWNGNIYITDFKGVTKVYTQEGHLAGTYPSPSGFLDAIGIADEKEFIGYRINAHGNDRQWLTFYGEDTLYNNVLRHKEYPEPKGYFYCRKYGDFVRTPDALLFKEQLNDTIYKVSTQTHSVNPYYWLKLDSLKGDPSLCYSLENPIMEVFRYTPYVMLLGEYRSMCWLTTVYSSYELQKQIYATHCYDRETGQVYSMELKMSLKDMGTNSQLLYDSTNYTPPSVNWDNFFPEQMSVDGRYLISPRRNNVLVIARLKEDPTAVFRADKSSTWQKALISFIIFLMIVSIYLLLHYRKSKQTVEQIKKQLSANDEELVHYRRKLEKAQASSLETTNSSQQSAELEQQIYLLEMQNEELRQRLNAIEQKGKARNAASAHLSVSDEGYNLFIKLKAEPSYIFIGEKEHEHLCRVTDKLYRQFATRIRTTYPDLTKHDIETCCLLKAGLTNQEISIIFNNTPAAITKSKNRIKKRMGLNGEVNLDSFLQAF